MAEGDAFAFDDVGAHGGGVEQDIDDVIVEQVDFVDVEQAAVGACQHAWLKMALAFLDGAFDIERADDAVFGGGNGQVDEGGVVCFRGAKGLRRRQNAPDIRYTRWSVWRGGRS